VALTVIIYTLHYLHLTPNFILVFCHLLLQLHYCPFIGVLYVAMSHVFAIVALACYILCSVQFV